MARSRSEGHRPVTGPRPPRPPSSAPHSSAALSPARWFSGGRYAGRPAIVLVRGTATGTWLLYLDARTFLPLAGELTGLFSEVTPPQPFRQRAVVTHAFIPVH